MESYEFEIWAQLPEDDRLGIDADEVGDIVDMDLSDEQVGQVLELLKASGMETSMEAVVEAMPQLHKALYEAAEQLAGKYMAVRKFVHNQYDVDEEDLFEDDMRRQLFSYQKPDDVECMDDEEGYADALYEWQQWESGRVMDMEPRACVEYLRSRYGIEAEMTDVDFGYRLPDELAAEAMAGWC